MSKNIFILLMIISVFFGCTTKKVQSSLETEDLIEVFDVDEDKVNKFKAMESEKPIPYESKDQIFEVEQKEGLEKSKKKFDIAPIPKKILSEVIKKPVKKRIKSGHDNGIEYPEDFPEGLKKYDTSSKKLWKQFRPRIIPGEKMVLVVSFLGITVGRLTLSVGDEVMINNQLAYHLVANIKSAKYYNMIYALDDTVQSFVEKDSFLPIKYSLVQIETGKRVNDLQLFDDEKFKTYIWYKKVKKGKNKEYKRETYIPQYFQDSYSAFHFIRGLPLRNGERYRFPVVTRGKISILDVKVVGRDVVEIDDNDINAIKLMAESYLPGVEDKKKGHMTLWYSRDESRRLLKFRAKIKIGSIYAELIKYSMPK